MALRRVRVRVTPCRLSRLEFKFTGKFTVTDSDLHDYGQRHGALRLLRPARPTWRPRPTCQTAGHRDLTVTFKFRVKLAGLNVTQPG